MAQSTAFSPDVPLHPGVNSQAAQRGCFITLEGIDGAGKSSHVDWLAGELRQHGVTAMQTREPGGTPVGERLRSLLLHDDMQPGTETLLMFAARYEHVETVIRPALARGVWVICDRFTDATYAYQGGGRQQDTARIQTLESWVHGDLQPDCTFLFDVPLATARERITRSREPDRFEHEQEQFFLRTQRAYRERAQASPMRFCIVDTRGSMAQTRAILAERLRRLMVQFAPQPLDEDPA